MKTKVDKLTYKNLWEYKENQIQKMKNEYKPKKRDSLKKLELKTTYIDNIMQKYILPRNKEVTYELYKAVKTNSLYLKLMYRRADCWIRFSDHNTNANIETLSIENQDIDPADVINTIQNRINKLSYKSKMEAFRMIEKEKTL